MRRSTNTDENDGATDATIGQSEPQQASTHDSCFGGKPETPSPQPEMAQRYLELLGGGDVPHLLQSYYDPDRKDPSKRRLARPIYGRFSDVWQKLLWLQERGAAIAVTMAETDGRGRKVVNMVRPRALFIEADRPLPRDLPLRPSIVVATSPGKYHYIYVVAGLDWQVWHGVQQLFIDAYGSDPLAALRTQVLRLPGTLHQKNPARRHLVRIVEELSSYRTYTVPEIVAAFPPKFAPQGPRHRQRTGSSRSRPERDLEKLTSALAAIDTWLQENGPFTAQEGPDDQPIRVDWSLYDWWLRATAAIHHASGGSDAGFELSCRASGGDSLSGLVGCPSKFDVAGQRRAWDSLSNDGSIGSLGRLVTERTIYWIAHRYCGWNAGRRGRPMAQPREGVEPTPRALAVAAAGRRAIATGLDRVRKVHSAHWGQSIKADALMGRILEEIRIRLDPRTGVAAIGSLTGMSDTLGCKAETLRSYFRELTQKGPILKNEGNATSMLRTSGITIALALPETLWEVLQLHQSTATSDPTIFDKTGIATPDFQAQAGWDPSRSPYSHVVGANPASCSEPGQKHAGDSRHPDAHLAALWHKPNLTLGDWFDAGVVHAEVGDHLERLANERGRGAVSRVLSRLLDIRAFRKSFREIRHDVEHAADLAAKAFARKNGERLGFTEVAVEDMVNRANPADIEAEDARDFVHELINQLEAMINQGAQAQMAAPDHQPGQGASPDQVIWPKLTTPQSQQLKRWIQELPEVIAAHCSALARKTGFAGSVGCLVDVLEFASHKLDAVALDLVIADAARRISFQGREKPPADLVGMRPGDCLARYLRKLVTILGAEQHLPDTPGYAAIKDRVRYARVGSGLACNTSQAETKADREADGPKSNAYAAARFKRDASAF
jgi:DNA primase RepB-like protein